VVQTSHSETPSLLSTVGFEVCWHPCTCATNVIADSPLVPRTRAERGKNHPIAYHLTHQTF
jgi:hypothetical protein